jgi:hypothetical protein
MAAGLRIDQTLAVCGSRNGPSGSSIYLGHPEFEGFESVLDLASAGKAA